MSDQIALSFVSDRSAPAFEYLNEILTRFGEDNRIEVVLHAFPWGEFWGETKQIAFQKGPASLSEIGSTWLGSLASMKALQPFTPQELNRLGGAESFVPTIWEETSLIGDRQVWAIPWVADARVIFYWQDIFEDAGIDGQTAFQNPQQMDRAFARLQERGFTTPWICPTARSYDSVHQIASWIWSGGGKFVIDGGKQIGFLETEALAGIRAYFALGRYMPLNRHPLSEGFMTESFTQRGAAAMIGGPWIRAGMENSGMSPAMLDKLGIALPPGPPFVGAESLVIWQHASPANKRLASDLIALLTSPEVQAAFPRLAAALPVRLDVLATPPYSTDPYFRVFGEALSRGRSLPNIPLWGRIEEELVNGLARIWQQIAAHPDGVLESAILNELEPLAKRLNRML